MVGHPHKDAQFPIAAATNSTHTGLTTAQSHHPTVWEPDLEDRNQGSFGGALSPAPSSFKGCEVFPTLCNPDLPATLLGVPPASQDTLTLAQSPLLSPLAV